MKTIFAAAALASLMTISGVASAANESLDIGTITGPTNAYSHTFTHDVLPFTDTIDFVVANGASISATNPLMLSIADVDGTNLTNLSYSLYGGNSHGGQTWFGTFDGTNSSYAVDLTMPGLYHLLVSGAGLNGVGGEQYVVSLTSAVPEPETYGMMLGGLGLLGFMARRKSAAKRA